jgi:hypothetical protein
LPVSASGASSRVFRPASANFLALRAEILVPAGAISSPVSASISGKSGFTPRQRSGW